MTMFAIIPILFCMSIVYLEVLDPDDHTHSLNVGRVNYGTMCDMQRMEKLVEGLDDNSVFMNEEEVCEWTGVTCDEEGENVLKIRWLHYVVRLQGTMDLSWIPPSVTYFHLEGHKVSSTFDASSLPRNLSYLNLTNCYFSGTVDWVQLPSTTERFFFRDNNLEGNVSLNELPKSIKFLSIGDNKFTSVTGKVPHGVTLWGLNDVQQ